MMTGNNRNEKNIYEAGSAFDKRKEKIMDALALILIIVGAINWGSLGLFGFDIVGSIFGGQLSALSRIIFTIVGLGGLWAITFFFKDKIMDKKTEA